MFSIWQLCVSLVVEGFYFQTYGNDSIFTIYMKNKLFLFIPVKFSNLHVNKKTNFWMQKYLQYYVVLL